MLIKGLVLGILYSFSYAASLGSQPKNLGVVEEERKGIRQPEEERKVNRKQSWQRDRHKRLHEKHIKDAATALQAPRRVRKRDPVCLLSLDTASTTLLDPLGNQDNNVEKCAWAGLSVSLVHREGVQACRNCFEAHSGNGDQGVILIDAWEGAFCPLNFHVDGEAIFVVPNDAASKVLNPIGGSIAVALRGNNSFADKARIVQEAGAIGLLIIDYLGPPKDKTSSTKSSWCSESFECGGWLGSRDYSDGESNDNEIGGIKGTSGSRSDQQKYKFMGASDDPELWRDIRIPVLFLTNRQGERLRSLMEVETVTVDDRTHFYVPD